jgi:hypothetical protein
MNSHRASSVSACFVVAIAACGGGGGGPPSGPHAIGSIAIGEAHASSGGSATASVSAGFAPNSEGDGAPAPECVYEVAGCRIAMTPDCGGTCGTDEHCTFSAACDSVCERTCDAVCGAGEECYFPTPDSPACRARQTFDAGAITITGTTTPVTLFPPYSFDGVDDGSLFLDGAELTVTAAGAIGAGYEPFAETFTATRVLRSDPPLDQLGILDVFGTGDVPVGWDAGEDDVEISAALIGVDGSVASVTCDAPDGDGAFAIPREAIDTALGGAGLDRMSITITRSRTKARYDVATVGELPGTEIQPTGWLELATVSSESATFEGCADGEQVCGAECIDTTSDRANCGDCDHACPGTDGCVSSTCSGTMSCNTCAEDASTGGACTAAYNACTADAACSAFRTCLGGCQTTACGQMCAQMHPDGTGLYNAWGQCICNTACDLECLNAC